jgi:Ca-activated chloride channel family protein
MLTFAHTWIFLLAPLPLIVRWLVPPEVRRRPAIRVPFLPRLLAARGSSSAGSSPNDRVSMISLVAVWLLVLTALARPQWLESPIERVIPTRDLLLLVDLSGSMDHEDFTNTAGDTVNRLTAVKEVVGDFLIRREGDRVGAHRIR